MKLIIGALFFIGGIAIRYGIKRRKYYRRFRPIQKQSFERYWQKNLVEGLLIFLYIFCFFIGAVLMFVGWNEHEEKVFRDKKHAAAQTHPSEALAAEKRNSPIRKNG